MGNPNALGAVRIPKAFGIDCDIDRKRCGADAGHLRVEAHQIAYEHRLVELDGIDGHCDHAPLGAAVGGDAAGDIDLREDPASEDIARDVGVGRHGYDA